VIKNFASSNPNNVCAINCTASVIRWLTVQDSSSSRHRQNQHCRKSVP
jgi:hypothetical protein